MNFSACYDHPSHNIGVTVGKGGRYTVDGFVGEFESGHCFSDAAYGDFRVLYYPTDSSSSSSSSASPDPDPDPKPNPHPESTPWYVYVGVGALFLLATAVLVLLVKNSRCRGSDDDAAYRELGDVNALN
jgi:hypothetical protein